MTTGAAARRAIHVTDALKPTAAQTVLNRPAGLVLVRDEGDAQEHALSDVEAVVAGRAKGLAAIGTGQRTHQGAGVGNDSGIGLAQRPALKVAKVDIVGDWLRDGYGRWVLRLTEIDANDEARRGAHKMPRACSA